MIVRRSGHADAILTRVLEDGAGQVIAVRPLELDFRHTLRRAFLNNMTSFSDRIPSTFAWLSRAALKRRPISLARVQASGHRPETRIWPIFGELKSRRGTHGKLNFKVT